MMVHTYETDLETLVIPNIVYDRALELSVNGNLNDRRTRAERYLRGWANATPTARGIIERMAEHRADIVSAILS